MLTHAATLAGVGKNMEHGIGTQTSFDYLILMTQNNLGNVYFAYQAKCTLTVISGKVHFD